ncbi:MAG: D-amino-acid transaminase [Syntrophothermus sp.]
MPKVFLNGEFVEHSQAKVSVEDRGFQFGDGIYEVIRCYNGRMFAVAPHLTRLVHGAGDIEIALPYGVDKFAEIGEILLKENRVDSGIYYIQTTRGVAMRNHIFPDGVEPTIVAMVWETKGVPPELRSDGCAAITVPDTRWGRCDIKSINLLPNVLAKEKAHRAGAYEAIFVRQGRWVSEASSSNVFAVLKGRLVTPPLDNILPGVTREIVMNIAAENGIPVAEEPISIDALRAADEVIITGTVTEVLPVVKIDGAPVAGGKPGPVAWRLHEAYRAKIAAETGGSR